MGTYKKEWSLKPVKPLSPAYDWIIVGGGLVGASIAYGLIQKQPQLRILVLDGSDTDYRASVGNFGSFGYKEKATIFLPMLIGVFKEPTYGLSLPSG